MSIQKLKEMIRFTECINVKIVVAIFLLLVFLVPYSASKSSLYSSNLKANFPTVLLQSSPLTQGCGLLSSSISSQIQQSSPWYCPINDQIYSYWKGELPLAIIAVLFAISVATVAFIVGVAFKIKRLREFGAAEFYEAFASALIVFMFLFVSASLFGLIPAIFVGSINPYATALHLISTTISDADSVIQSLFNVYLVAQFINSISVTFSFEGGETISLVAGLLLNTVKLLITILYSIPANVLFDFIIDGIYALYFEYYLIIFFAIAAIPVFLVPGVIFRAILPARPLGGFLIAVAIGFYFVMPTLFAVVFQLTAPTLGTQLTQAASNLSLYDSGSAFNGSNLGLLATTLQNLQTSISSFWLLILFYPVLIVSITYAFITQVANIIGGVSYSIGKLRGIV